MHTRVHRHAHTHTHLSCISIWLQKRVKHSCFLSSWLMRSLYTVNSTYLKSILCSVFAKLASTIIPDQDTECPIFSEASLRFPLSFPLRWLLSDFHHCRHELWTSYTLFNTIYTYMLYVWALFLNIPSVKYLNGAICSKNLLFFATWGSTIWMCHSLFHSQALGLFLTLD